MKTFMILLMAVGLSGCVLESQEDQYVKQCMPIKKQEFLNWANKIQEMCNQQRTQFTCNWARQLEKDYQNLSDHDLRYQCLRSIHIKDG